MATDTIESTGIDTTTPLTVEARAAIALFFQTLHTMETDGGTKEGPAEQLARKVATLLWGSAIFTPDPNDENAAGDYDAFTGDNADGSAKPQDYDGPAMMSLRGLLNTGRATRAECVKMSLATAADRTAFIKSRAPVPAGTFTDDAERDRQEKEADAIVDRAFGRVPVSHHIKHLVNK